MARAEDFDIHKVIEMIQGTCKYTVESAVEELYPDMDESDITMDDYSEVDNQIFLCDDCGWWCEIGEANENPNGGSDICDDCNESNEDGDDD